MSRKKEWYRDTATHAFIKYAYLGFPTKIERENQIRNECYKKYALSNPSFIAVKVEESIIKKTGELKDIDAVNRVLDILKKQDKTHIIEAIKEVYFVNPKGKPERGEIVERVTAYAMKCPASTKAVYEWLKSARLLFAQLRELDTGGDDERW